MINLFMTPVTGVTYEGRQSLIAAMKSGDPVKFVAEPYNKYDPQAIAVQNMHGETLGYIAKFEDRSRRIPNQMREKIHRALDVGFVYAKADKVGGFPLQGGGHASLGLRVKWCCVPASFDPQEEKEEAPDPIPQRHRKNSKQAKKKGGKEYRDVMVKMKRKHPGKFTYQEIQNLKSA